MRFTAPAVILLAGASFWYFSHGGTNRVMAMKSYAESIDHPVAPQQAGRLAQVLVTIGQQVKMGEVVARMDTTQMQLQHRIALAELKKAKDELAAQEVLQHAAVARTELLVLRTVTRQGEVQARLQATDSQVERLQKLSEQQLVPTRELEASHLRQAGLAATSAVLARATAQKQAGLGRSLTATNTAADLEKRLAPFREAVAIRELAVETADLALERTSIRSGVDGVVSAIVHYAGDVVATGTEVVRVTNGRPNFVVSWLGEQYANAVVPGQMARLREMRILSASFGGRVVEVSPTVEEVPTRARVAPHIPAWGRRVIVEAWPSRLLLPGEALHVSL